YVEALTGAAEVLRGILNNVSDFSRLENGTLPLEPIGFDLRVMIEDLAAVLEVGEDVARPAGSGIRVTVEDSGPAIPPDLLPTLFEPFVRGDAYANRD